MQPNFCQFTGLSVWFGSVKKCKRYSVYWKIIFIMHWFKVANIYELLISIKCVPYNYETKKYCTCFTVRAGRGKPKGGRRFHSSTNAFKQWEECVPMVCTVDVGRISLEQLMKAISHLSADPGQNMGFHHKQETQGKEHLHVGSQIMKKEENQSADILRSR